MGVLLLGIAGMTLIIAGWLVSLKGEPPPLRLSILYFAGSILLTLYAILLSDPVFTVLNIGASLVSGLNMFKAARRRSRRVVGPKG